MPAAHDIYTEQLRDLRRGHPLYHPEPRPEGPVEIGDVGYTKDGAFRRLFNVSKPANDPIQRFGVPDGFVQLDLGAIDAFDAVLEPGPLHSRTISTLSTDIGTPGGILPAEASFRFSCSSKRGAILMLETQMMREEAVQSRRLEAYVVQHCRSWHAFARDLDIHVGFGDLMLVTECSKTAAWSSAVYSNSSTEFGLSFSVGVPFSTAGISASSSLEKIGPVERRRSQKRAQAYDVPLPKDHTVFIKAYRVGMRQMYYQSLVSLFVKSRSSSLTHGEGMSGTRSRSPSTSSSNNSSPLTSPGGSQIIGPYEPDFHPSLALLALEMEKNDHPEFVVLHDDVWCSMAPDSDKSRIMDEYTEFYFSDFVTDYLNSMLGEIPYDEEFLPSDIDEFMFSNYPDLGGEDLIYQSTDPISSLPESVIELISPALLGEDFPSHLRSAYKTDRYIFTETGQTTKQTTTMFPNITFENKRRPVHGMNQEDADHAHPEPSGSQPTEYSTDPHIPGRTRPLSRRYKEHKRDRLLHEIREQSAHIEELMSKFSQTAFPFIGAAYESDVPEVRITQSHTQEKRKGKETFAESVAHHDPLYRTPKTHTDPTHEDILTAVMGRTGTGKSSFINMLPGKSPATGPRMAPSGSYQSRPYHQSSPIESSDTRDRRSTPARHRSSDSDPPIPPIGHGAQGCFVCHSRCTVCVDSLAEADPNIANHHESQHVFSSVVRGRKSWRTLRVGPCADADSPMYTSPSSRLSKEEEVANLVLRGMHLLAGRLRPGGDVLRRRRGLVWQRPDTSNSWKVGLRNITEVYTNPHLMVRAYSMFARIMGVDSAAIAGELDALILERWGSMTREEREELCRIFYEILQGVGREMRWSAVANSL